MRPAWINSKQTLQARLANPRQVEPTTPEAEMPPYLESFLAHIRLLIGVPFDYLMPDARLLPDESIRFFYVDPSWTDRLIDGAISVGKIGTREQAHHQGQNDAVTKQLDVTTRGVRDLQRGAISFLDLRDNPRTVTDPVITGFLLRSGAVSGWPQMDVRAYNIVLPNNYDPANLPAGAKQLPTLRLERLSPGVLIALFEGVPKMVVCEEPHHGIQFGVHEHGGQFSVFRRNPGAAAIGGTVDVHVRASNPRVLALADLRRTLKKDNALASQTGSASFAIELLNLPFRQRFAGTGGNVRFTGLGQFAPITMVAGNVKDMNLQAAVQGVFK
jgi:hypothetical protein